jgi:hypothetical protein
MEKVLQQAGSNRKELEKVLTHYSRNPADSLKLRAAEFLIVNMPGKYSIGYDAPWENIATVCLRWTSSSNKQLVLNTYNLGKQSVREDVRYITAGYLINNIDMAFKVWRETPWGKHIPFDIFCEEILPYRVDAEPLEDWRKKALTGFAELYDELKNNPTTTAVTACRRVNALLPECRLDNDFPFMNYSSMMASARSTCNGMAALAIFAMRAMGIPVVCDYTVQYPRSRNGHSWNSVCDSSGKHISFMGTETAPGKLHQGTKWIASKIYRKMFALQNPVQTEQANIPTRLETRRIKDVSQEYAGHINIEVAVRFPPVVNTGYAYLSTLLFDGNGWQWNPIAWGQMENQCIHFNLIGKKILYLPVYYANHQQTPAGFPFYLDNAGNMQYFEPDVASCRKHVFYSSGTSYSGEPIKIIAGTTYELRYWDGKNWQSLGKQIARDVSVSFRVPDNALLYIRTVGEINDHFPFFYIRNNKQYWLFINTHHEQSGEKKS